jgi:hypothetical protein
MTKEDLEFRTGQGHIVKPYLKNKQTACNPCHSGGRDQEDGSQPRQIVHKTLSQNK